MSGAYPIGDAAAPLSDVERTDARRFCGYPIYGTGTTDDPFYRFTTTFVQLESHLSNMTDAEVATCRARLATLATAEAQLEAMGATLIVDTAAVFKRNANELADRQRFFDNLRRRFCGFLGVPPGPALAQSANSVRMVV